MNNIVKQALTEVDHAGQGRIIDKVQLACLIYSESIVEPIVESVLLGMNFIQPIVDIVRKLMDHSFDAQYLENVVWAWTPTILIDHLHESSSVRPHKSSKSSAQKESRDRRSGSRWKHTGPFITYVQKSRNLPIHSSDSET